MALSCEVTTAKQTISWFSIKITSILLRVFQVSASLFTVLSLFDQLSVLNTEVKVLF